MVRSARSMAGLPWIAAMAFFMQALDATILNTALPAIAHSLHRSPLAMQSAIISYTLTVAMLIPVSGWLADRYGTRKIFTLAVFLFALGSLCCAISSSLTMLVSSRILQGIGGAMMMPVARLALLRAYPRNELLPILNFVTLPGLVGPVLGPVLGGIFVTYASWHWIFLINIPIAIVGIFCALKFMPDFTTPKRRFDMLGFLVFGFSMVCLSMGIDLLGEQKTVPWLALGIFASGIIFMGIYVWHARRYQSPLINLQMFKIRTFSVGIIGNITSRLGTGCVPFLVPLMLQVVFGYSALIAGCIMVPMALASMMAKSTVTPLLKRLGYRRTLITVTCSIGLLIISLAFTSVNYSIYSLLLPLFLLGLAMSTQFTSMNTITLADLSNEQASGGNSVLAVTQQLAVSFGVAVSAAVLNFWHNQSGTIDSHFHATFITMGLLTLLASLVFTRLQTNDGNNLIDK